MLACVSVEAEVHSRTYVLRCSSTVFNEVGSLHQTQSSQTWLIPRELAPGTLESQVCLPSTHMQLGSELRSSCLTFKHRAISQSFF